MAGAHDGKADTPVKNEPAAAQPASLVAANARHVELIRRLMLRADTVELPLWLTGGWAVDARLGRETAQQVLELAHALGGHREIDVRVEGVVLDCEPCVHRDGGRAVDGMPADSCPEAKEGRIAATALRCASWQALLWSYFDHLQRRPLASWAPKYRDGYALAREAVGPVQAEAWLALYRAQGARA